MKGKKEKSGLMEGATVKKFKATEDTVSMPTGGNQAPRKKVEKVGKFKIG